MRPRSTPSDLYPEIPIPKGAWRWIDSTEFRLASHGRHQALSVVDCLICATATHHRLIVLHDDRDFRTASEVIPDLWQHNVHDLPVD